MARRRQLRGDLKERWLEGTGGAKRYTSCKGCESHPSCMLALEAELWQACFFLGGRRMEVG